MLIRSVQLRSWWNELGQRRPGSGACARPDACWRRILVGLRADHACRPVHSRQLRHWRAVIMSRIEQSYAGGCCCSAPTGGCSPSMHPRRRRRSRPDTRRGGGGRAAQPGTGSRRNDVLDDKRRLRLDSSISCPCCATSRKSRALRVRGVSDTANVSRLPDRP
jgi:hypothetical protein